MLPNFSRAALCANDKGKSPLFRVVLFDQRSRSSTSQWREEKRDYGILVLTGSPVFSSRLDRFQILMLTMGFIDHSFEKGLPAKQKALAI
jgi:hypothetical protein